MQSLGSFLELGLAAARNSAMAMGAVLILTMATLGTVDVVSTAAFSQPVVLTQELSELMLAMTVFLVLPIAQYRREHIEVDILTARLGPRAQAMLDILGGLVGFGFMGAVTVRLWAHAAESYEIAETAVALLHFPIWPAKIVCAFGATAASAEFLRLVVLAVLRLRRGG